MFEADPEVLMDWALCRGCPPHAYAASGEPIDRWRIICTAWANECRCAPEPGLGQCGPKLGRQGDLSE